MKSSTKDWIAVSGIGAATLLMIVALVTSVLALTNIMNRQTLTADPAAIIESDYVLISQMEHGGNQAKVYRNQEGTDCILVEETPDEYVFTKIQCPHTWAIDKLTGDNR